MLDQTDGYVEKEIIVIDDVEYAIIQEIDLEGTSYAYLMNTSDYKDFKIRKNLVTEEGEFLTTLDSEEEYDLALKAFAEPFMGKGIDELMAMLLSAQLECAFIAISDFQSIGAFIDKFNEIKELFSEVSASYHILNYAESDGSKQMVEYPLIDIQHDEDTISVVYDKEGELYIIVYSADKIEVDSTSFIQGNDYYLILRNGEKRFICFCFTI